MTMRFNYLMVNMPHAVASLRGRRQRPRPIIGVTLTGPHGVLVRDARLDTGADDTVFPESCAQRIGITPSGAPTGQAGTALRATAQLWYAPVTLRIADHQEQRVWQAWVGFTSAPLNMPLLGFAGFLEYFDTLFLGAREAVELTVNASYTGT